MTDDVHEYELRAERDGEVRTETVYGDDRNVPRHAVPLFVHEHAEPWEVRDADASMSAHVRIIGLAYEDSVWARGRITLTHKRTGRVVRTMDAKP